MLLALRRNSLESCPHVTIALMKPDPTDCSPPGSSFHGLLPGKNTECVAIPRLQVIFPTQRSNPAPGWHGTPAICHREVQHSHTTVPLIKPELMAGLVFLFFQKLFFRQKKQHPETSMDEVHQIGLSDNFQLHRLSPQAPLEPTCSTLPPPQHKHNDGRAFILINKQAVTAIVTLSLPSLMRSMCIY